MRILKIHFSKNGLEYTLMKRSDKIALFQLGPTEYPDGYEVCRIYIMRPHKAFGVDFEESGVISTNDQFFKDGSGAFRCLDNANALNSSTHPFYYFLINHLINTINFLNSYCPIRLSIADQLP